MRSIARTERAAQRREEAAQGLATRLTVPEILRLWLRIAGLVLALMVHLPMHYLFRLLRLPSPWPRLFLGSAAWICGARVKPKLNSAGGTRRERELVSI